MIAQEPSPQEPSALPKLPAAAKLPAAGTAAAATGDGCCAGHDHDHNHNHDHDHGTATTATTATTTATTTAGPRRAILTNDDLARFQRTDTSQRFVAFLESLNAAVRNKTLRQDVAVSPTVAAVLAMLDTLDAWAADIEPDEASKSRFGNVSFQLWHDRLVARSDELVASFVPDGTTFQPAPAVDVVPAEPSAPADASANASADSPADAPASVTGDAAHRPDLPPLDTAAVRLEVATYLQHSFGNRKRIDYGTGHEAHFIAFLLCLDRLGLVSVQDYPALVLRVFWRYIGVMRTLQFRYWLEPAGSHGVWGLDDYHFLPFYFGASQLADHKHLRPKCIHDPDIVSDFSKDYMYLACIAFINAVKTSASLRWHSPMLDDISGVKKWTKVNEGMLKMYKAEVLGKLPIMQHFLFGAILPFEGSAFDPNVASEHHGHDHVHAFGQLAPDCCGMRIPSAIAATQGANKQQQALRRPLPFD